MSFEPSNPRGSARTSPPSLAYILLAALTLFCTGWSEPIGATARISSNPLEELRGQELRVAQVAYRLAVENRSYCTKAASPQFGFVLHGIEQYEVADRARVSATFGLGPNVGVMAVVPFSSAQKAGLKPDDQLVSVNGRALGGGIDISSGVPTRAAIQRAEDIILAEMKKGEVTLGVADKQGPREIHFAAESGCLSNVELLPGEAVNAWADGERVVVGAGLLKWCKTDDDLALIIAHELAHNLLGHSHRSATKNDPNGQMLGIRGSGSAIMRKAEEEADRLAVSLTVVAAYDVSGAEAFMSTLLDVRDRSSDTGTHPATARRLGLLKAEVAAALGA